jgi:hypothetical protein
VKKPDVVPFDLAAEETCWREWFEGCSIEKCSPESRALLASKGRQAFRNWLLTYDATDEFGHVLEGESPWLIFEEFMLDKGKQYKRWLRRISDTVKVTDAQSRTKVVNANVNHSLFRTVVRKWIVEESGPLRRRSTGGLTGHVAEPYPEEDVDIYLAAMSVKSGRSHAPDTGTMDLDCGAMAQSITAELLALTSEAAKVAIAAKLSLVSLANPGLKRFSGVGHSQTNASLRQLHTKVESCVRRKFPKVDPEVVVGIAREAILMIIEDTRQWLERPENRELLDFLKAEGKQHEAF